MGFLKIKIKGLGFLIGLSIKPNIIALMYVTLKKKSQTTLALRRLEHEFHIQGQAGYLVNFRLTLAT